MLCSLNKNRWIKSISQQKCQIVAARATRVRHKQHESDTSETRATRVQHEGNTRATQTTRVKSFDFHNGMNENIF